MTEQNTDRTTETPETPETREAAEAEVEPEVEAEVEAWLVGQLDALTAAFGIGDDAAMAAITVASLAYEVGEVVVDGAGDAPVDLDLGAEELQAYADRVLASEPGGDGEGDGGDPGQGLDAETLLSLLEQLGDADAAEATLSQTLNFAASDPADDADDTDDDAEIRLGAVGLAVLAEALEPTAPRASRAALAWLRGRAHEVLGDLAAAEVAHEAALDHDADWSPALYDLARMASDRGDAARGLSLLRRSDAGEDDVLVELLQRFVPRDRTDLGRNDPCWCGSGRKYKVCHRGRETLDLVERLPWLVAKADLHLGYGSAGATLHDLAAWWVSGQAAAQSDPQAELDAIGDPLLRDAVLVEGGGLQTYAVERGSLLPDDERRLVDRLASAPRTVFEVVSTGSITAQLRHLPAPGIPAVAAGATAETIEVDARGLAGIRRGDVVVARLLELDGVRHAVGVVEPVSAAAAPRVAAGLAEGPDPYELVQLIFDAMPDADSGADGGSGSGTPERLD